MLELQYFFEKIKYNLNAIPILIRPILEKSS